MYCMRSETLELKLEIVPVSSLVPHEKVIPDAADELILEFSNWTNLQNPVIVDENNMVLDGHHRFFVFKSLHFKYMPICKIKYLSKSVQLRYWFRIIERITDLKEIRDIIENMKGSFRHVADKETMATMLRQNPYFMGIQAPHAFAVVSFTGEKVSDAVSAYDVLEQFQCRMMEKGVDIRYIPCQNITKNDSKYCLKSGQVVIWTPQITKNMVVEAVQQGKKFAPKATRHLVPARPLHVDVPTRWLKEDIPIEEINRRFVELLKRKRIKRFGPGQIVNGRYYEEELFVFYDERT